MARRPPCSAAKLPAKAHRATAGSPARALKDKIVFKGDADYEGMREFGIFNARKPNRYPEAIVMAESVDDVIAAVKLARAMGAEVTVFTTDEAKVAEAEKLATSSTQWKAAGDRMRAIVEASR